MGFMLALIAILALTVLMVARLDCSRCLAWLAGRSARIRSARLLRGGCVMPAFPGPPDYRDHQYLLPGRLPGLFV